MSALTAWTPSWRVKWRCDGCYIEGAVATSEFVDFDESTPYAPRAPRARGTRRGGLRTERPAELPADALPARVPVPLPEEWEEAVDEPLIEWTPIQIGAWMPSRRWLENIDRGAAFPPFRELTMTALRESAPDCPHCMGCEKPNHDRQQICLAHSNALADGRGKDYKTPDILGALLCAECHDCVDGRRGGWEKDRKRDFHRQAWARTVRWWIDVGLVGTTA